MTKRMLVDATHPEETRVVVLNGNRIEEFDYETSTKKQIKGNIYLAKVTRVEPSLQAAFVEYGGNRHGFLAFNEIHPDYYRIPIADREAAIAADRDAEAAFDRHEEEHGVSEQTAVEPVEIPEQPLGAPNDEHADEHADSHAGDEGEHAQPEAVPERARRGFLDELLGPILGRSDSARATREAEDTGGTTAPHDAHGETDLGQNAPPQGERDHDMPNTEHADDGGQDRAAEPHRPDNGATAEAGAAELPIRVETVGGDEMEERRPRTRSFRSYKIQEVIKRRQIMLVQVTKEERGNKGAALTTYISLAGRYCVLMPNTPRGGGVSRKITSSTDRRRLKDLMSDLEVPDGMGVIVRTAGSERTKPEIKRDFEYLRRLWDDIRDLTLKSTAPALVYEEGSLIKRSIRDLYSRDLEEVVIDGADAYATAKGFMKMLMPTHAQRVKLYRDATVPLFHRYQVEGQLDAIHSPTVQLKSGGYIVINPTEALVAIDVNSGRSTRERNIEETATKTNLEAADEVARQLRLRDLAGLIVIDFIDMDEHRNQHAVERRLKEAMRHDRARIQLGRISPFGLLELSRQRLRPSLLEASTQPCPYCEGTGHIRSTESTALHVLRAIEEEGVRRRTAEITVAVPNPVALYILNQKRSTLQQAEGRYGFRVTIVSDEALIPPAFRLERGRAFTPSEIAALPAPVATPAPVEEEDESILPAEDDDLPMPQSPAPFQQGSSESAQSSESGEDRGKRRRRRRRGGKGRNRERGGEPGQGLHAAHEGHVPHDGGYAPVEPGQPMVMEGDDTQPFVPGDDQPQYQGAPNGGIASEDGPQQEGDGTKKRRRRGRRGGRRRRRGGAADGPGGQPGGMSPADASGGPYRDDQTQTHDQGQDYAQDQGNAPRHDQHPYRQDDSRHETVSGGMSPPPAYQPQPSYPDRAPPHSYAPELPRSSAPAPAPVRPEPVVAPAPESAAPAAPPANPKKGWWRR
jgi:ribonuclease E